MYNMRRISKAVFRLLEGYPVKAIIINKTKNEIKTKIIIYSNTKFFTLLIEQNIRIKYNSLIELKSYIYAIKNKKSHKLYHIKYLSRTQPF